MMMKGAGTTMEAVDIGNARLVYHRRPPLDSKSGEPVIFLHPWFGSWQHWRRPVEALPEYDTYSVDLYSLGASENWRDFAGPREMARAIGTMIEELHLEGPTVIGNSMGGVTAQALAIDRGRQIGKLILVGTGARTFGVKPEWRKALDDWIAGGPDRGFTERMVDALLARRPDPKEFEAFVEEVAKANKAFMGTVLNTAFELDLRPLLREITAPTLVVRGEHDASRTPVHVAELMAGILDCRAIEIPDAGHSPQVDSPAAFAAAVRDFLAI
jgi:pimeloyl-ACP methyl ester carboxylesterase